MTRVQAINMTTTGTHRISSHQLDGTRSGRRVAYECSFHIKLNYAEQKRGSRCCYSTWKARSRGLHLRSWHFLQRFRKSTDFMDASLPFHDAIQWSMLLARQCLCACYTTFSTSTFNVDATVCHMLLLDPSTGLKREVDA
jgi:hypothetical protein